MLTHGNLLHQTAIRFAPTMPYDETEPLPGDVMLALLPVWHVTERAAELCVLTRGCTLIYTSIRTLKSDLATYKPQWLVLVPRVLEKIAQGVQTKLFNKSSTVRLLVKFFTLTGKAQAKHKKIAKGLVLGPKKPNIVKKARSKILVAALEPLNFLGNIMVWKKVKSGLGGRVKVVFSGGSALAKSLESFYETCGIDVLVGYGLTETSPVLAHRRSDANLVAGGCVGKPILDTTLRIVDPHSRPNEGERQALPDGTVGLLLARGPQIMQGYYNKENKTKEVIDRYGWFDTGDLGMINPATGDLIIVGRSKDTIVLSNGENIEPTAIEDAILSGSAMIEQVMLTAGQDGKQLAAIAVLHPTSLVQSCFLDKDEGEKLQDAFDKVNDPKCTGEECAESLKALNKAAGNLRKNEDLMDVLKSEVKKSCACFKPWEQVREVCVTLEPFAMVNGLLTQSYKIKRDCIFSRYEKELNTN